MIRSRLNRVDFLLRLVTLLLPVLAFGAAAYFRFLSGLFLQSDPDLRYTDYLGLLFLSTLVWSLAVEFYRLAQVSHLYPVNAAVARTIWACAVTYALIAGAVFFYRGVTFSRLFVMFSAAALLILELISQAVFRTVLRCLHQNGNAYSTVLVVGTDEHAQRAARSLETSPVMPCRIAAYAVLPGQRVTVTGAEVVPLDAITYWPGISMIEDVVIALPPSRLPEIREIVAKLDFLSVPMRAVLDFGEGLLNRDALFHLGELTLLDLRSSPAESVTYSILKRSFDLFFASSVLIVTSPIMLLIAMLIRLTSPGSAIFPQERVGLNGRPFRMYKFRTMRQGDSEESDTRWTTAQDPRRTRLGSLLRKTNLDELPQFFNVVKGEMSVVGPRPERPFFVKKFLQGVVRYNTRHYLKVGVTGWAQVNGWRGDSSIAKRVEFDLYYLRNWSLGFDLKIILLTLWRSFFDKNAY
jgi:Undecaprenyl-phosphate glucose phosphotransferase